MVVTSCDYEAATLVIDSRGEAAHTADDGSGGQSTRKAAVCQPSQAAKSRAVVQLEAMPLRPLPSSSCAELFALSLQCP